MNEKLYPIVYNKDHYTVVANDVIKGKQEMNLQVARMIRLLVTQVVKQDNDLKTYTCRIQDIANFLGIDSSNIYRGVLDFCDNLLDSKVRINTGNPRQPWKVFQWVQLASYDGNGNITLMLSNQIKPYVIQLEKYFTQYKLENILAMNSFYAIRLYELIKCEDNFTREQKLFHEFSINDLREFFSCEKKYSATKDFKKFVIETAIREINKKSDIWICVEYIKTGRSITSVKFELHDGEFMRRHYDP